MALFKGDRKLTLFKGDRRPFAIYKGDKQITGAVKTHLEGTDIVKWESPYKADIPNVETEGLGTQDKLSGKNLLDIHSVERKDLAGAVSTIKENSLVLTATKTNDDWRDTYWYFTVKPNTNYTLSCKVIKKTNPLATSRIIVDGKGVSVDKENMDEYNISFNSKSNDKIRMIFYLDKNRGDSNIKEGDKTVYGFIQFEQGTQATEYEPYCGGIPAPNPQYPIEPRFNSGNKFKINTPPQEIDIPILRAIPNTEFKDTYDAQRGIITRRVEELTLTGEEYWDDNYKPKIYFILQSDKHGILMKNSAISNYSLKCGITNSAGTGIGFGNMTEFGCNTADEFKAFLKQKFTEGNPVKIWYALKTPYEEKVSTTPLRQDWNGQLMQTGGDCGYAPMRADVFTEFRR